MKNNRILMMRVIACLMAVFLSILSVGVLATRTLAGDDKKNDFSFYRVASAASAYYDQTHNDKKDNKVDFDTFQQDGATLSQLNNIGVAGDLVGFIDEDYSKGFFGATVSMLSASSQSRAYTSFRKNEKALIAYVQYGHALQMLGLDETANTSLDISAIVRFIIGIFLIMAYSLAVMVDLLFKAILVVLQALNPFAWFLGSHAVDTPFRSWFASAADHMPTALKGVQELVSTFYKGLSDIGLMLIPVFFVMLVAGIILFRSGKGAMGDSVLVKIRKYVTRVVFILAGIPILGASYTGCLEQLLSGKDSDPFSVSTSAANDVIGSTLVDFESWAVKKHLALPENVKITLDHADTLGGSINTGRTSDLRQMARNINAMANPRLTRPTSTVSAMNGVAIDVGKASASDKPVSIVAAYDVMLRYMMHNYYQAANLETQYKAKHAGKKITGKSPSGGFWDEVSDFLGMTPDSLADLIEADSDVNNYKNHNKLAGSKTTGPYMNDNTLGALHVQKSGKSLVYTGNGSGKGLSTLAMYNYLTSGFTSTSVITYSNHKIAALIMSNAHRSVSVIGTGAARSLYILYAIVMLIAMAVIGFGYALGVLFGMFRRGVSMIMSTPFAMMGNFRAMAKVTTITAMMIVELIGTVFAYQIVIFFLTNILDIFMVPVYQVIKPSVILPVMNTIGVPAASTSSIGGQALQVGVLLLAIVMLIVFTVTAMKLRKSLVKTMDEQVAGIVDRIFSPSGHEAGGAGSAYANKPTLGDKLANGAKQAAGAAGTGAAMSAANNLMQGKPLLAGLSKGDAALPTGNVADGTAEGDEFKVEDKGKGKDTGKNPGIEGGDKQGLPNGKGKSALTGAGSLPEDQAGQKLIGGESLSDNANGAVDNAAGDVAADGMAVGGAELANDNADSTANINGNMAAGNIAAGDTVKTIGEAAAGTAGTAGTAGNTAKGVAGTAKGAKGIAGAAQGRTTGVKPRAGARNQATAKSLRTNSQQTLSEMRGQQAARQNGQAASQNSAGQGQAPQQGQVTYSAGQGQAPVMPMPNSYKAVYNGSHQARSMSDSQFQTTLNAAQSAQVSYGDYRSGERVVQMAEGQTSSKDYQKQAKAYTKRAVQIQQVIRRNPSAQSYTFDGATYDKAGLIKNMQRYEREADLRQRAVQLRQDRVADAKADRQAGRKAMMKKLIPFGKGKSK